MKNEHYFMLARLHSFYRRHQLFLLICLLFVSFRLLAILLFRPGGFIADFSDYDFYYTWGKLMPQGYRAYDNLWTAYPPLFPALMLPIFELSSRIPPWVDPRLFFHTFLGGALLVFETGNLVLIYRLARKLGPGPDREKKEVESVSESTSLNSSLVPPLLYALLFAPVYTLLGWFEPMPLFFMLLGLDLLLTGRTRAWGWVGSAVAAGLGFLTKLTPALLLPIAVRWLGAKLSWAAARREWLAKDSRGNLLRPTLYTLVFVAIVGGVGYPLVRDNPALALSSFRIQSIRPPWQSLWAVLDGYFGYGLVPLDMRNLAGLNGPLWESHLPWGFITLGFVLVYLWLYTRPYDWRRPRTPIVFAAISVIWLFLYSKGWSPQFVVWILAFIVLLLPTLRGVAIAIVLTAANFVEANIFLILLPDEHWLLWGTVLLRTGLLLLLAGDFIGQIWPTQTGMRLRRASGRLVWTILALALVAAVVVTPRAARAYTQRRLAEHPCPGAIHYLQSEAAWPNHTVATEQIEVWQSFYPWLRHTYQLRVIDTYSPGRDPDQVLAERLAALGEEGEFWWLTMGEQSSNLYFSRPDVQQVDRQTFGACTLSRILQIPSTPQAVVDVSGGPIELLGVEMGRARPGQSLHLVLYWQAQAPVTESYTVFTQLFDPAGHLVAQQDNLPVQGMAPTQTWEPAVVIRDPYQLALPAQAPPGRYRLVMGMYDSAGRRTLTLPSGVRQEQIERSLSVQP